MNAKLKKIQQTAESALMDLEKRLRARCDIAHARREAIDRLYQPLAIATWGPEKTEPEGVRVYRLGEALESATRIYDGLRERQQRVCEAMTALDHGVEAQTRSRDLGRAVRKATRVAPEIA